MNEPKNDSKLFKNDKMAKRIFVNSELNAHFFRIGKVNV